MIIGPKTNLAFLSALLRSPEFTAGTIDTGFIDANLGRLGAEPHPPRQRAVHAAARLLVVRRDEGRASPLNPFDPWRDRRFLRARRLPPHRPRCRCRRRSDRACISSRARTSSASRASRRAARSRSTRPRAAFTPSPAGGRRSFKLIDPFAKAGRGADDGRRGDPRADERSARRARGSGGRGGRGGHTPRGGGGDEDGARARRSARRRRARPHRESSATRSRWASASCGWRPRDTGARGPPKARGQNDSGCVR